MKRTLFIISLFLVTWSFLFGQAMLPLTMVPKSTTSGHATQYRTGDTVYSALISTIQYDSLVPTMVATDSVKVIVDYRNVYPNANSINSLLASGDWIAADTLIGNVDGGTTAPYGNIMKPKGSLLIKNPISPWAQLRYRFIAPSPLSGNTRKTYKTWLTVYKH